PLCKMRLAASVASAFIDDTAACRPRITGRIVRGKAASGPWAMALEAKLKQAISMYVTSVLCETVISTPPELKALGIRLVISSSSVHRAFYTVQDCSFYEMQYWSGRASGRSGLMGPAVGGACWKWQRHPAFSHPEDSQ